MSKTTRLYQDARTANAANSNLDKLNDELQDVTRIMTKNMEELLWRGDSLDSTPSYIAVNFETRLCLLFPLRNVTLINFASVRVRKVSEGIAQPQLPVHDSAVRPARCDWFYLPYRYLLEVLIIHSSLPHDSLCHFV